MKKIRNILIALVFASSMFACVDDIKFGNNFLEKAPGSDVNIDTIFNHAEYARYFLWNTYSDLYFGLPWGWSGKSQKMNQGVFETLSDCYHSTIGWDGAFRMYYPATYTATEENDRGDTRWTFKGERAWECIRNSYIFIENVGRVPDMDDNEKARLTAEAKIMIAMRYFDMFRHYGGLPLLYASGSLEDERWIPRASVEETVEFMTGLLDEAIAEPNLPWKLSDTELANWDGRLSAGGASGLKTSIYLFAASPLFNDSAPYNTKTNASSEEQLAWWTGGAKQELWQKTVQACEDFFRDNGTNFALLQPAAATHEAYGEAFENAYRSKAGNNEMLIYVRNRNMDQSWEFWLNTFANRGEPEGAFCPTLNYADMFPMADGSPANFDWDNPSNVTDVFYRWDDVNGDGILASGDVSSELVPTRDPRLYKTLWVNGMTFRGEPTQFWEGGVHKKSYAASTSHGIGLWKYLREQRRRPDQEAFWGSIYLLWPYLRMAEVHLNYAEALAETGNLPGAIAQVNMVRSRVGLKGIELARPEVTGNKDALIEEILRERACEMGMEDVRFFDMIRRKLKDDFEKPLYGIRITRNDGGGEWSSADPEFPVDYTYERFRIEARAWQTTGFGTEYYLHAFPPSEINMGYGLYQNPGW